MQKTIDGSSRHRIMYMQALNKEFLWRWIRWEAMNKK